MISVISEVATAYFQLLALDRGLEIAQRTTNSFGESLRIFSERFQGGIVSKLETSAAEAALASAAATVPTSNAKLSSSKIALTSSSAEIPDLFRASKASFNNPRRKFRRGCPLHCSNADPISAKPNKTSIPPMLKSGSPSQTSFRNSVLRRSWVRSVPNSPLSRQVVPMRGTSPPTLPSDFPRRPARRPISAGESVSR